MAETMTSLPFRVAAIALTGVGLWLVAPRSAAQEAPSNQRGLTVVARKYAFEPARLEVNLNDLVKVTLSSPDIAHSFTVDAYRIAKRVGGGQRSPSSSGPISPARSPSTAICDRTSDAGRCTASWSFTQ